MSFGAAGRNALNPENAAAIRRDIDRREDVSQAFCTYICFPLFILIMFSCAVMLVFGFGTIAFNSPVAAVGIILFIVLTFAVQIAWERC